MPFESPALNTGLSQKQGSGGGGSEPEDNTSKLTDDNLKPYTSSTPTPYQQQVSKSTSTPTNSGIQDNLSTTAAPQTATSVPSDTSTEQAPAAASTLQSSSRTNLRTSKYTSIYTSGGVATTVTATITSGPSNSLPPLQRQSGREASPDQAQLIGIVIGVLALLIISLFGGGFYLWRRRSNARRAEEMLQRTPPPFIPYLPASPSSTTSSHLDPFGNHNAIPPHLMDGMGPDVESHYIERNTNLATGMGSSALAMATDSGSRNSSSNALMPGFSSTAASTRDPSPAPIQGIGQLARPYSGAALVTVPALLPSYEESQSHVSHGRDASAQQQRGRDLTHNALFQPPNPPSRQDMLEAEYEAEAAQMAGFAAPSRTLGAEREALEGGSGSGSRGLRGVLVGAWGKDSKKVNSRGFPDDSK